MLVHVVEEVLDEWVARVMVHYRWHYIENTVHVIEELTGKKLSMDEARTHPMRGGAVLARDRSAQQVTVARGAIGQKAHGVGPPPGFDKEVGMGVAPLCIGVVQPQRRL